MKPNTLLPGDTIAVVAPASAPRDPDVFHQGIRLLESRGFRVECPRMDFERRGYLSGSDETRLSELNYFFSRPDIKAIFCARGGYGVTRILPHLDYETARNNPKLIVGYSDITALHFALLAKAGWTGLSGPLVVEWPRMDASSTEMFWSLALGDFPVTFTSPDGDPLKPLSPGIAEGTLVGGNLTLIAQLVGTPYCPNLEGSILFLEEVGEPAYRIDRAFSTLQLAGVLDKLGGVAMGSFTETGEEIGQKGVDLSVEDVIHDYFADAAYPVATGLCYGHYPNKTSLPVGVRARLSVDADSAELIALESVTEGPYHA